MEMEIVDSFGPLKDNFVVLNVDEYCFTVGSFLVVKQFKTNFSKKYKILNSETSHFSAIDFCSLKKTLVVCEAGINAEIKLFHYSNEEGFTPISSYLLPEALEVTNVSISRDGQRILVTLPEPWFKVKIFDVDKSSDLQEVASVDVEAEYFYCRISPVKKDFVFLMRSYECLLIELRDSFKEFETKLSRSNKEEDLTEIKQEEEARVEKRCELKHLRNQEQMDEFVDFAWDMYNNIYVAKSSSELAIYDTDLLQLPLQGGSSGLYSIQLGSCPTSLLLTQRHLLCAMENGNIALVNIYIQEKELASFKPSIGNPENYMMLCSEREVTPTIFVNNNQMTEGLGDCIVKMRYDPGYKKIVAVGRSNSLMVLMMKAEQLLKEKEKEEISENSALISDEIESYEETKFHSDMVLGVKELGSSSQLISLGKDKKVVIWELSERNVKYTHHLNCEPSSFEVDQEGNLLFVGSSKNVLRIYDISNRSVLRLIYQMKFSSDLGAIDKIVLHPSGKYLLFYRSGDTVIYFVSTDLKKNFNFLGYLPVLLPILDVSLCSTTDEILVLVKQMLLAYKVRGFVTEHRKAIEVKPQKSNDIFTNFQIGYESLLARKVDSDLEKLINDPSSEQVWATGRDKYLRLYALPKEYFEVLKDNKKPPENPIKDIPAHNLEISFGIVSGNLLITTSKDGCLQIRTETKDFNVTKSIRTNSFIKKGIAAVSFSPTRHLLYLSGADGSMFLLAQEEGYEVPLEPINPALGETAVQLEALDSVNFVADSGVKNFRNVIEEEHNLLVKKMKKSNQSAIQLKIDEIKSDLNKFLGENSRLEDYEKLPVEEMIVDTETVEKELKHNEKEAEELTRTYFNELWEIKVKKDKLMDKTYNVMRTKEGETDKFVNNNIRMVSSLDGQHVLKSYPIRRTEDHEVVRLNYVKQLRLMELNEKYKRRNNGEKEVIAEQDFSNGQEPYIINRAPGKITLVETEIKPQDVEERAGTESEQKVSAEQQFKMPKKYRLQRDPYMDEAFRAGKQDQEGDQTLFHPDEQLLKEDLMVKFKTVAEYTKEIPDIEFQKSLTEVSTFSLLYSPFELYTNFRIRNQIYILIDIIQQLKLNFNKEFKTFIAEKNSLLEKFNTNKTAIESINEILISLDSEVHVNDYSYVVNPHEDQEWVTRVDSKDIPVPKYLSMEEKFRMEEERRREEERLKALQGDTLEMRGLNSMIEQKNSKGKQAGRDEQDLHKEPWMDTKKKEEMSDEEFKKYTEYKKREKEARETKEKIRSQNITKLNNHKMELENLKSELDLKFLKMLKKKIYYDYRVTEQELYILSLMRTMEKREELAETCKQLRVNREKVKKSREQIFDQFQKFSQAYDEFYATYESVVTEYAEKNKSARILDNLERSLLDSLELSQEEKDYLQKLRLDPFYFVEREKLKQTLKYGPKPYHELRPIGNQRSNQLENIELINKKYYFEYKRGQLAQYHRHLESQKENIKAEEEVLDAEGKTNEDLLEVSKLNFDLLLRLKRSQDEITDENGPQEYVDEALLVDSFNIEELNKAISNVYKVKSAYMNTKKDNNEISNYLMLENILTELSKHEIELKLRYLKLTRVTKKIQEIVTGREEIDQNQMAMIYDQKKRNLEDNKNSRVETMFKKIDELRKEIEKKKRENLEFVVKLQKLIEEVDLKKQIIKLDVDEIPGSSDEVNMNKLKKNKTLEIAQVTSLKSKVQQYYEQIEYLRAELDKLRARTFPSFLQKSDQVIYPDEK